MVCLTTVLQLFSNLWSPHTLPAVLSWWVAAVVVAFVFPVLVHYFIDWPVDGPPQGRTWIEPTNGQTPATFSNMYKLRICGTNCLLNWPGNICKFCKPQHVVQLIEVHCGCGCVCECDQPTDRPFCLEAFFYAITTGTDAEDSFKSLKFVSMHCIRPVHCGFLSL